MEMTRRTIWECDLVIAALHVPNIAVRILDALESVHEKSSQHTRNPYQAFEKQFSPTAKSANSMSCQFSRSVRGQGPRGSLYWSPSSPLQRLLAAMSGLTSGFTH